MKRAWAWWAVVSVVDRDVRGRMSRGRKGGGEPGGGGDGL